MSRASSIESAWREESGNVAIELIGWFAFLMLPLLLLVLAGLRAELTFAAGQNIAREIARQSSMGLSTQGVLQEVAADFSVDPARFRATVACWPTGVSCTHVLVRVLAADQPNLPAAIAIMRKQAS